MLRSEKSGKQRSCEAAKLRSEEDGGRGSKLRSGRYRRRIPPSGKRACKRPVASLAFLCTARGICLRYELNRQ
jgi:hypothetical protein